MVRKWLLLVAMAVGGMGVNPARSVAADQTSGDDVMVWVNDGVKLVHESISLWHKWNDSHPCVQVDGNVYYVPLIPSKESRGTINFSQDPLRSTKEKPADNAIIRVEFVNFGRFKDSAQFQVKVDKHHAEDRDRGHIVKNGQETEIGIGASIRGFYFAIRGNVNTEQILNENPNAYIKVTLIKNPA